VVHHGGQQQVGRGDADADLLERLTRRAVGEGLAFVELAARQVEHAVAVPGALTFEEQDLLLTLEDDVHVDDRPVPLGHPSSRRSVSAGDRSVRTAAVSCPGLPLTAGPPLRRPRVPVSDGRRAAVR
jgi:hypothetical protein